MADGRWEELGVVVVASARVGVDGGRPAPGTGQLAVRLDRDRAHGQILASLCAAVPTGVATIQAELTPADAWRVAQLLVEAVAAGASRNVAAEFAADLDAATAELRVAGELLVPLAERTGGTIVAFPAREGPGG